MTSGDALLPVAGFVLAGGKSSRMGCDKALLELAGGPSSTTPSPTSRLLRGCRHPRRNPALAPFATLVADLHPGCGPLGGIEAALTPTRHLWSLILPVDVPFLPSAILEQWVGATLTKPGDDGTRVAIFVVDGRPQPALLLIHRDLAPYVSAAIARGALRLLPVLSAAAQDLATRSNLPANVIFRQWPWSSGLPVDQSASNLPDQPEADPGCIRIPRRPGPSQTSSSQTSTHPATSRRPPGTSRPLNETKHSPSPHR